MFAPEYGGHAQIQENSMGTVEPQAVAGSEVRQASRGQVVAKMLKQEGIKHIFWVAWICREVRNFRPVYLPRQYPLEKHLFN